MVSCERSLPIAVQAKRIKEMEWTLPPPSLNTLQHFRIIEILIY